MYNSKIYRQQYGIALDECSSSMMADLYIFITMKRFFFFIKNSHLYRYIDDIISTNNSNCLFPVDYPSNLQLKFSG